MRERRQPFEKEQELRLRLPVQKTFRGEVWVLFPFVGRKMEKDIEHVNGSVENTETRYYCSVNLYLPCTSTVIFDHTTVMFKICTYFSGDLSRRVDYYFS